MISLKDVMSFRTAVTIVLALIVGIFYTSSKSLIAIAIYIPFIGLFIPKTRYVSYVFIGRVLLPITVGFAVIWVWETAHSQVVYAAYLRAAIRDFASIRDYFSVLSTLYAICVAFLLWKGLSDYDNLRTVLRNEAGTIFSIHEFAKYLESSPENNPKIYSLNLILKQYVENILSGRRIKTNVENEKFLSRAVKIVGEFKISEENDKIALSEIMKEINNLWHIRSLRSSHMETRMSPYLLFMLAIISSLLLMPFILREPNDAFVLHFLIFTLTTFFCFLYLMLLDIDDPFDGYWSIKTEAFEFVAEKLQETLDDDALVISPQMEEH